MGRATVVGGDSRRNSPRRRTPTGPGASSSPPPASKPSMTGAYGLARGSTAPLKPARSATVAKGLTGPSNRSCGPSDTEDSADRQPPESRLLQGCPPARPSW